MERWNGRVALVTGASAGIGTAVVRSLVSCGMKVVGCARRMDRLQELAEELTQYSGQFFPMKCDLSNEDEILAMFDSIRSNPQLGGVDVCVNNAGVSKAAPILNGKTEDWRAMIDVNVIAVSICVRESVKSMTARGVDGHIFIISSTLAYQVLPITPIHVYTAGKFAVRALSDGIRNELREMKSPIKISTVSPGTVESEMMYKACHEVPELVKQFYNRFKALQPEDIAQQVLNALQSPSHVQIKDIIVESIEQPFIPSL